MNQKTGLVTSKTATLETDEVVSQLPRPDFSQMIPYKPKLTTFPGEHPLAGGTFPQPPALAALCSQLPPPNCFRGPFVAIDLMVDLFNRIQLPDSKGIHTSMIIVVFNLLPLSRFSTCS